MSMGHLFAQSTSGARIVLSNFGKVPHGGKRWFDRFGFISP